MIDTHCHVHDRSFDADRDEVIERARNAGVRTMLTVGEDVADSREAIRIAQRYEIRAAVGIHPHEAAKAGPEFERELAALLGEPGVVALGEIGLDYYYDHSPREVQLDVFRRQLRVGREHRSPIVFHQRDAFDDFTGVLRDEWTPQMRGVVHCFTGTPEQARVFVEEFALFLGIGGVLTFPKAQPVRDAARAVGARALVLETDCPYLAPVPNRGKRNEPAFLTHTAAALAQVLDRSVEDVAIATEENAFTLFGM